MRGRDNPSVRQQCWIRDTWLWFAPAQMADSKSRTKGRYRLLVIVCATAFILNNDSPSSNSLLIGDSPWITLEAHSYV
jgi:hypothetical protein